GTFAPRGVERIDTGRRGGHAVSRLRQMIRDERDDVRFVVDDEDPLACGGTRRRLGHAGSDVATGRVVAFACVSVARFVASRPSIFATIISTATRLRPPCGTIRSAYRLLGSTNCQCIGRTVVMY